MTFNAIRTVEDGGQTWYLLEDVCRWLHVSQDKARRHLKHCPGLSRQMLLAINRYDKLRCTYCTGGGVVLVAAEYSKIPNYQVRALVAHEIPSAASGRGAQWRYGDGKG